MAWETPSGTINGTTGSDGNPTFTTAGLIFDETLLMDRLVQMPGVDYTTSGQTITFLAPSIPIAGSTLRIRYTAVSATAATSSGALDYSSAGLLAMIRDVTYVGNSVRDWPDDKLLRLVNRQIEEYLLPFIMSARKNNMVTYKDTPLVSGQRNYYLPSAASGMKSRALHIVDAAGINYASLQERELEDAIGYGNNFLVGSLPSGIPQIYWFEGNQLWLYPTPGGFPAGLSIRAHYVNRPSTLVGTSSAIQITGFPGGAPGGSYRISYTGTAPTGLTAAAAVDLVQNKPGFDILQSTVLTAIGVGTADITGTQPSSLAIGDWLCTTGTAPVVTGAIPEMVIGCLIRVCQLEILSTKSDDASFNRASKMFALSEKRALQFLNRRNTGDRPKFGIMSTLRFKRSAGWNTWG